MNPNEIDPTKLPSVLVRFSGMAFGVSDPEAALQAVADLMRVTTVALIRQNVGKQGSTLLFQNTKGQLTEMRWQMAIDQNRAQILLLDEDQSTRDILLLKQSSSLITDAGRAMLETMTPFLTEAWQSRAPMFERAISQAKSIPTADILGPTNPCNLTPTELHICRLISEGHRPKQIAALTETSMATTRTHLRHIYSKTGLDGLVGVLHHMQRYTTRSELAA